MSSCKENRSGRWSCNTDMLTNEQKPGTIGCLKSKKVVKDKALCL